jgi:hypothetical protein
MTKPLEGDGVANSQEGEEPHAARPRRLRCFWRLLRVSLILFVIIGAADVIFETIPYMPKFQGTLSVAGEGGK